MRECVRQFDAGGHHYQIIKEAIGAMQRFLIVDQDDADGLMEFVPRSRTSYLINYAGGCIGGIIAKKTGYEMIDRTRCFRHPTIAGIGDRLGAIEASARVFLPS